MTSAVGCVGSTTILLFNGGATSSEGFGCLLAEAAEPRERINAHAEERQSDLRCVRNGFL